ncbi:MAG: NAD(P)-dependent oxidoreductase, partial [archaeon]|nr:NAD(P)-dependent oxidoreductase [archaeon]
MNFWEGKNVVVTGANGFIGAWLCEKLVGKGATVTGIVHGSQELLEMHGITEKVNAIKGDVRNPSELKEAFSNKPVVCFHLAAVSSVKDASESLDLAFDINVNGTKNILEAAAEVGAAVVFVSSVKTYGGQTETCFSEEDELLGKSAYAKSKIAAETECKKASGAGLSVAIARPGNVFGGKDSNLTRLVPGAIKQILDKKQPQVTGKGESLLDFVYVEDVAEGLILIGKKAVESRLGAEAFNLGSGEFHSVKDVVEILLDLAGSSQKIV